MHASAVKSWLLIFLWVVEIHFRKKQEVVEAAGLEYHENWREAVNQFLNAWGKPALFQNIQASASSSAAQPEPKRRRVSASKVRAVDEAGHETGDARLVNLGFEIGQSVVRKSDDVLGTIHALGTNVIVQLSSDGNLYSLPQQAFIAEWKQQPRGQMPERIQVFSDAQSSLDKMHVKSSVFLAMTNMTTVWQGIEVQTKPNKKVFATKKWAKGKLLLVPLTWRIEIHEQPNSTGVELGKSPQGYVQLMAPSGYIPWWCMATSDEKDKCNMDLGIDV